MAQAASILLNLGGNDSQLAQVLNRASARLSAFGKSVQAIGGKISGLGKSVSIYAGIAGAPLAGAVQQFMSFGDTLDKTSQKIGVSAEALSELKYAAEQGGGSFDDITSAISTMSNVLTKASAKSGKMLESIGLSFADLEGLTPEKAFEKIGSALSDVDDAMLRTTAAQTLLGGSGAKLLPMLGSIKELRSEAKALGLTFSTDAASSAADLSTAFTRITSTIKSVMYSIGSALAPTITDLANRIASVISTIKTWTDNNKPLILTIGKMIAGAALIGTGLVALGSTITIVGIAVSGLAAGLGMIATIAGAVLSPIGLLVAGIAGGGYAFLTMTEAGQRLMDFFTSEFTNLYNIVKPIIDGITSAFKMGDFSGAASIAFAAVKIPALSLWAFLKGIWNDGVFYLMSLWDEISFGMTKVWTIVKSGLTWDFLKIGLLYVGKFISNTFFTVVNGIVDMFGWMVKQVAGALYALRIISDKTLIGVNSTVREISKSIQGLRDGNNQYYQRQIDAGNRKIDESEGGRELKALEQAKNESIQRRAQTAQESNNEAQSAIVNAQNELAELLRKQEELADNFKPPDAGAEPKTPIEKALKINPKKVAQESKMDVGSTASFNSHIASMLANNAKNKIEEQQLDVLKQIAENTNDINTGYAD